MKKLAIQGNDIKNNSDFLKKQKDILEEQQRNIGTLTDSIQKVNARIEKVRENLQDEIGRQKEEIDSKFNEVEFFQTNQFEKHQVAIEHQEKVQETELTRIREEFSQLLTKETESLNNFVNGITNQAQKQRLDLADKYDKKLNKIKEICA